MRYCSTRGGCNNLTFEEALFSGYLEDGGLVIPQEIPKLQQKTLQSWSQLSYKEIAKRILPLFVDENEIPDKDIHDILERGYNKIQHPEVAPIKRLSGGLNIHEQFYGPTMAFKDLALCCVGLFLDYFLQKKKQHHVALVGTSGDTGSAAIEAVRGSEWLDIIVFLPKGRCSKLQELWMTTAIADNVHVYRVDGTSDDLDQPIKRCFEDVHFKREHNLLSINSINWARIMMQIVSYFYGYIQMCPQCDKELEVVVPTGACGNITAGLLARKMGLPIKFVSTVTPNDIVARTVQSGDYSLSETVTPSLAPSMDIQCPYNMERIWYLFLDGDTETIRKLCREFELNKGILVPESLQRKIKDVVSSYVATDDEILQTMKRCWKESQYILDPHTSVAVSYHYRNPPSESGPGRLCISTASHAKFPETVKVAGLTPEPNEQTDRILNLPTSYRDLGKEDDWLNILQSKIEDITKRHKDADV